MNQPGPPRKTEFRTMGAVALVASGCLAFTLVRLAVNAGQEAPHLVTDMPTLLAMALLGGLALFGAAVGIKLLVTRTTDEASIERPLEGRPPRGD